jgi:uncharacterized protein (TIGR00369 family)
MDRDAFFWQIQEGKLPAPQAAQTLGMRILSVDPEKGVLEAEFQGRDEFANPAGNIQGGFLTAMLDDTMSPALSATLAKGEFAPTVSLSVQFLAPAKPGVLRAVGRIVKRGGICFLAGELSQQGRVVATAVATAAIRKL